MSQGTHSRKEEMVLISFTHNKCTNVCVYFAVTKVFLLQNKENHKFSYIMKEYEKGDSKKLKWITCSNDMNKVMMC